jgi:hypothetical protein
MPCAAFSWQTLISSNCLLDACELGLELHPSTLPGGFPGGRSARTSPSTELLVSTTRHVQIIEAARRAAAQIAKVQTRQEIEEQPRCEAVARLPVVLRINKGPKRPDKLVWNDVVAWL